MGCTQGRQGGPRFHRLLCPTASQDAEGKPGKGPCLLGPLITEPQNQKGAELGAEDKASQEVSLSHCSVPPLKTPGAAHSTVHHLMPCLLPCQVTKDHQAPSWAAMLVAIMDPTVGWEEPHREEEGMCVHAREVENGGPLTPTWQSRGRDAQTFLHPLLKHRPLECRQQAHPPCSPKEISAAGQQQGLKLEEHLDAEEKTSS